MNIIFLLDLGKQQFKIYTVKTEACLMEILAFYYVSDIVKVSPEVLLCLFGLIHKD